jgi:hypothetical protein
MVELRLETLCGDVRPMLVVLPPDRICRSPPAPDAYPPLFCSKDLWGDRAIEERYYDNTQINEGKGERWFCTEQEAVGAGWRKAKV